MHEQLHTGNCALERLAMVEEQLRNRGIRDERVLTAMGRVPRHLFVDPERRGQAYADAPLPIAEGQTISQPYMVAAMLEALEIRPEHRILEIGTGSGYETAVLAELANSIYTVERYADMAESAGRTLDRLGYHNVFIRIGDGTEGFTDAAPFDGIVVSAAAPRIPEPLTAQLKDGGRMVIPVGPPHGQELQLVRKEEGEIVVTFVGNCVFVPLIGRYGY